MKTLLMVVVGLLLILSSARAKSPHDEVAAGTASVRDNSIFKLKTHRKFVGATVEIYQANGTLVTSQNLERRRMAIDFRGVRYGTYTIRVTKGANTQVFEYVKK